MRQGGLITNHKQTHAQDMRAGHTAGVHETMFDLFLLHLYSNGQHRCCECVCHLCIRHNKYGNCLNITNDVFY